jgi:hypothetical protein
MFGKRAESFVGVYMQAGFEHCILTSNFTIFSKPAQTYFDHLSHFANLDELLPICVIRKISFL